MRINNNMMAINTHRQLKLNNTAGAKSIEKLSSGYRINRAGDDAAGLAISEKMRSQVRGLNQASRNAQDDISLVQTTEGALNETHAIIHRMREMAVQSANDTNTDEDRQALQNEMDQLAQEVTRIANNTEFNTRKLLNGNLHAEGNGGPANSVGDLTFHIGANTDQNMKFSVKAMDAFSLGLTENIEHAAAVASTGTITGGAATYTASDASGTLNGYTITFTQTSTAGDPLAATVSGNTINVTWGSTNAPSTAAAIEGAIQGATGGTAETNAITFSDGGGTFALSDLTGNSITFAGGSPEVMAADSAAATFDANHGVATEAVVAKGINISDQASANTAITRIDSALKAVSDQRAELGAVQNRLSHTIKNLDVSSENLQASESRIRDVDMAKEMMNFTKNNILQQASQAMLAQANQAPQGVLQLLR